VRVDRAKLGQRTAERAPTVRNGVFKGTRAHSRGRYAAGTSNDVVIVQIVQRPKSRIIAAQQRKSGKKTPCPPPRSNPTRRGLIAKQRDFRYRQGSRQRRLHMAPAVRELTRSDRAGGVPRRSTCGELATNHPPPHRVEILEFHANPPAQWLDGREAGIAQLRWLLVPVDSMRSILIMSHMVHGVGVPRRLMPIVSDVTILPRGVISAWRLCN